MAAKSPARLPNSASPLSSPRLPSPPPLPELQLGPQSPSINATTAEIRLDTSAAQDEGAARRIRPGTSAAEMAKGPPFLPLHQLESPFQLQEYLKSSYISATREESSNTVKPITRETAMKLATPPIQQDTGESVDRNLWLYELCRFLVHRTNRLIVSFFADNPPCSSQTCPEMRASEWQYLCAVHEPPKSCCAIDYCCHTLDWAANVLTSSRHFPSRLALGGEGGNAQLSIKQLTNIFRRVYRIYAHAWFQHREVFWSLEQEEGLYKFYKTVCDAYSLIPDDNYTVPPEAEGDREDMEETPVSQFPRDIQILRNETPVNVIPPPTLPKETDSPPAAAVPTTGATTRRHRHTPSTGTQVTSIAEGAEDEDENSQNTQSQISQQIPADPTATSTNATQPISKSPPKHPRSPRPTSIPITAPKMDFHVPEDPTPTPERHNSDPFSENVSDVAGILTPLSSETSEPSTSEHSTELKTSSSPLKSISSTSRDLDIDKEPPTPLSAINTNQPLPTHSTMSPVTKSSAADDDEILRSPGGGSIRTVSNDFLSGILAHCDPSEEDETEQTPVNQSSSTAIELPHQKDKEEKEETKTAEKHPEAPQEHKKEHEAVKEEEVQATEEVKEHHEKGEAAKTQQEIEEPSKEPEHDEEMGEIKLDATKTSASSSASTAIATATTTTTEVKSDSVTDKEKKEEAEEEEEEEEEEEKSTETKEAKEPMKEDSTIASTDSSNGTSEETKETPAGVV